MTVGVLLPLLAVSALFDVWDIPLSDPDAPVFLAPADADKAADVFVLNGNSLTAWSTGAYHQAATSVLAEGTSGFDIADINGDGESEVVAVCGDNIMSYRLAGPGSAHGAKTLFVLRNQLSAPSVQPFPYVMVIRYEDVQALALPCETTFELRKFDGTLITSFPIGTATSHRISYGSPFSAAWVEEPQAGPAASIEAEVNRVISFEPELPDNLLQIAAPPVGYRRGTLLQAQEAARAGYDSWPWFPLKSDGTSIHRALYALAAPDYRESLVCVRSANSEEVDLSGRNVEIGPERRYPGVLCVLPDEVPDFNGDGYVDLLLWQAPDPGWSVDSLTRVALGQKWPVNVTAHLFNAGKKRFEPQPASHITLKIPADWFMAITPAGPLRQMVLRDFNGDGRTDLGCATSPNEWAAWLFYEEGFAARPAFSVRFEEPIERVEFRAALERGGATSVGLRTRTVLHVLHPQVP